MLVETNGSYLYSYFINLTFDSVDLMFCRIQLFIWTCEWDMLAILERLTFRAELAEKIPSGKKLESP